MAKQKTLSTKDITVVGTKGKRHGVSNFGDLVGKDAHVQLRDYDGQVIYIVKLENLPSVNFGDGYRVTFGDMPNAKDLYTAGVYGQYPKAQLDALYAATSNGNQINRDNAVRVKIVKAGNSYRFE